MTHLMLAAIAFLVTHFIASTPLRAALVARLGNAYLALYSLLAFVTLGWMIWAFNHAPFVNLWYAVALRPVPLVVMPFALIFVVSARMPSSELRRPGKITALPLFLHS